jgi:hypothetical protein
MRINEDIDGWIVIGLGPGLRQLAFQRAADWIPPRWPDPACPQQMHLDIRERRRPGKQELLALTLSESPVRERRVSGFSPNPSPPVLHRFRTPKHRLNRRPHLQIGPSALRLGT